MGDYTQCIKVNEVDWKGKYCSLKKKGYFFETPYPTDFVRIINLHPAKVCLSFINAFVHITRNMDSAYLANATQQISNY